MVEATWTQIRIHKIKSKKKKKQKQKTKVELTILAKELNIKYYLEREEKDWTHTISRASQMRKLGLKLEHFKWIRAVHNYLQKRPEDWL